MALCCFRRRWPTCLLRFGKEYGPRCECLRQRAEGAAVYLPRHPAPIACADKAEIGGEAVASRYQYTFHMKSMAPTKTSKGGEVRIVDSAQLSRFEAYCRGSGHRQAGRHARTPLAPECLRVAVLHRRQRPHDGVLSCRQCPHDGLQCQRRRIRSLERPTYIENTGDTDLVFLETFATDEFMDVSLNQWLRRVPSEMLKAHLNIDKETAMKIPAEKL